jgi:hypothetical protein
MDGLVPPRPAAGVDCNPQIPQLGRKNGWCAQKFETVGLRPRNALSLGKGKAGTTTFIIFNVAQKMTQPLF